MDCNKMLTGFSCFTHQMLQKTEAETTECYEMIYKLVPSHTFRNVLIHFVNWISAFGCIPVLSIPESRSSDYDNLPSNFDRGWR